METNNDFKALLEIPNLEIEKLLFAEGDFDFITVVGGQKHLKQEQALQLLTDDTTRELGYGGAAGGAKSWTGCAWLGPMCMIYPGTRWFIGREELKRLRESTYMTFKKVSKAYEFEDQWEYKAKDNYIEFFNGSRIDLLDLRYLPSDPLYERYGSLEYTGGWLEEGGEVHFDAFDTLKSRVGRHLNDHYGIIPKLLVTFNPKKNWVDSYFYRPWSRGTLPKGRVYLPALLYDNPHRESGYEEQLKGMSKAKRERLLHGNFDYDDDPSLLCDQDAVYDLFRGEHVLPGPDRYISADLAMMGRDKFVAGLWEGAVCDLTKGVVKGTSTGKEIEADLALLMRKHSVPRSRVVADSDGMGSYLESYLEGIQEFHGGARAFNAEEFANLKSECGYKLAELINKRQIRIICSSEQELAITEELGVLKENNVDNDTAKKRLIDKDEMKKLIQRSPDYLDMLMMRMFFYLEDPDDSDSDNSWASSFR